MEDGLRSYREHLRQQAREEHYRATVVWALLAPHQKDPKKPPEPPAILRD